MDYSLHSICLDSEQPFRFLISEPAAKTAPIIRFRFAPTPLPAPSDTAVDMGRALAPEDQGELLLQRDGPTFTFQTPTVGQFLVAPDDTGILCHARPDFHPGHLQHQVLRIALSIALHQRRIINLHASSVCLDGTRQAVALMGHPTQGKSTLTAALVRWGHSLLGDDLLAVSLEPSGVQAYPGLGYIRLCRDACEWLGIEAAGAASAQKLLITAAALGGQAVRQPLPLALLALLERSRQAEGAQLIPLSPPEALVALVAHTSLRHFLPPLLFQPLLGQYAHLLQRVPVCRLIYPDGWGGLMQAEQAIREALPASTAEPSSLERTPCLLTR